MPRFLVALYRPDDYDPATAEDAAMREEIAALNREMVAAGIRDFVGGLHAPGAAASVRIGRDGGPLVTDGPYLETKEHIGGLWVLNVADRAAALAWAEKAARACRAPVEVHPFH